LYELLVKCGSARKFDYKLSGITVSIAADTHKLITKVKSVGALLDKEFFKNW
jgi:hypothetical protein